MKIYPTKEYNNYGENNPKLKPCRTVGWALENRLYFYNGYNHDKESAAIMSNIESARINCIPEGKSISERDEKFILKTRTKLGINGNQLARKDSGRQIS